MRKKNSQDTFKAQKESVDKQLDEWNEKKWPRTWALRNKKKEQKNYIDCSINGSLHRWIVANMTSSPKLRRAIRPLGFS